MADDEKEFTKKECRTCKPTVSVSQEDHKMNVCKDSYNAMTICMSQYKGNISSCKAEWSAFRICFDRKQKSADSTIKYDGR